HEAEELVIETGGEEAEPVGFAGDGFVVWPGAIHETIGPHGESAVAPGKAGRRGAGGGEVLGADRLGGEKAGEERAEVKGKQDAERDAAERSSKDFAEDGFHSGGAGGGKPRSESGGMKAEKAGVADFGRSLVGSVRGGDDNVQAASTGMFCAFGLKRRESGVVDRRMSTTVSPLRMGFIGAGGNTRSRHLPGFAALSGVELVAVANRTTASSEAVAR